jgi:hypothetical protein
VTGKPDSMVIGLEISGLILINSEDKCTNSPLTQGFTQAEVNTAHLHGSIYHGKRMLHSMWAMGMPISTA